MRQISRAAVIWQLIAVAATVLPHVGWMPLWLTGFCILTASGRLMIHTGRWPLPHWSAKLLLIVAVSVGLLLTFSRETGMEATVALLIAGLALKLVEIYHRRDALVLLYVSLFVLATGFLFHQSILMALYALSSVVVVIAALNSIYQDPQRTDLLRPLRRSVRLVGLSLPLMVVLFILFPRIGPLWSMSMNQQSAVSGLSDSLAPGDISRLTKSDRLAFRVSFRGRVPEPPQRYWRSLIYTEFDGRTWRIAPGHERWRLKPETLTDTGDEVHYEVIYEPSNRHWLVALDQPLEAPSGMKLGPGQILLRAQVVDRRLSYSLRSVLDSVLEPVLGEHASGLYRRLPAAGNARSRELASTWWQEGGGDPERFVDRALQYFGRSFTYTLTPPALGGDPIDGFLFETQQGFCGHYAGALTFMLRSVGIPARVVGGYLGGEWNPYEQYLTVRQYDAHAWVEYWMEGKGWVRVDPTAAVSPERIIESADQVFAGDPAFLSDVPLGRLRFGRSGWLVELRQQVEALNFNWHRWVLNYQGRQMELLSGLMGQVSMLKMVLALMIPFGVMLLFVAWIQLKGRSTRPVDPLDRTLHKLLVRLGRMGYPRQPDETLRRYARRVGRECPELAHALETLAEKDESVRYAGDAGQRHQLLAAIRRCRRILRRMRYRVTGSGR